MYIYVFIPNSQLLGKKRMACGRYMRCSLHYLQRLQHFARVGIKGVNIDLARAIRGLWLF